MKCPTCGANLQIENEKCPFCGNPNPFAEKHRQDMRYYHSEFQKTKSEVEQKTRRFTSAAVKIPLIVILAILIFVLINSGRDIQWEIKSHKIEKNIKANEQEYREQMDAYELAGDWVGLSTYWDEKHLSYAESFREYYVIQTAASRYGSILGYIMNYTKDSPYYNAESVSGHIADGLGYFYQTVYRTGYEGSYYESSYTEVHKEALERIKEDMDALLFTYCHLTKEEIDELPDYSTSKRSVIIEEGLLRGGD